MVLAAAMGQPCSTAANQPVPACILHMVAFTGSRRKVQQSRVHLAATPAPMSVMLVAGTQQLCHDVVCPAELVMHLAPSTSSITGVHPVAVSLVHCGKIICGPPIQSGSPIVCLFVSQSKLSCCKPQLCSGGCNASNVF
jgi:hypothetical protein